jgi:hypothetical protein
MSADFFLTVVSKAGCRKFQGQPLLRAAGLWVVAFDWTFARLVDGMGEVPDAEMTPAGEAGEGRDASGVWSGTVDLASTPTLSIFWLF